jgi:hypothetical protein
MSDPETFLSRWLRLKRESEAALPPAEAASSAAFDPTSLPAIESIVADTDIRQFLHEAVPPELTRAALRSAWTADPAIRDFVGIAENQWDFNDHASIPGFGPLVAADYLAARAVEGLTNVVPATAQEQAEQPAPAHSEPLEAARPAAAAPVTEETGAVPSSHGGALPR